MFPGGKQIHTSTTQPCRAHAATQHNGKEGSKVGRCWLPPLQQFIHISVESAGWMSCRLKPDREPLAWWISHCHFVSKTVGMQPFIDQQPPGLWISGCLQDRRTKVLCVGWLHLFVAALPALCLEPTAVFYTLICPVWKTYVPFVQIQF